MGVVGADEVALYNAIRHASSRKGTDGDDVVDGASVGCDEDSRLLRGADKQLVLFAFVFVFQDAEAADSCIDGCVEFVL